MADTPLQLSLPDGRVLAWAEYGDPAGRPVFHFHGVPGCRLERHPDGSIARDLGIRLIVPDRPGMGRSTPQPGRSLLDWPDDVAALADHLGVDRFHAIGVSGGCPYTLACAYRLRDRLHAVALVSGIGPIATVAGATRGMIPLERLALAVARYAPWVLGVPFGLVAKRVKCDHEWRLKKRVMRVPSADDELAASPEIQRVFREIFREATRQGGRSIAHEAHLLASPWPFDPAALDASLPMFLWHGEADTIVPVSSGRYLAGVLPNCRATFLPGEGHYLVFPRFHEILATLTGDAARGLQSKMA